MSTSGVPTPVVAPVNRWVQLVAGVICMVMIANLQYGWTYFVDPIDAKFHWGRTSIQVAFTIFVLLETWPMNTFIHWRMQLRRGQTPDTSRARALYLVNHIEMALVVLIVFVASFMARGFGIR